MREFWRWYVVGVTFYGIGLLSIHAFKAPLVGYVFYAAMAVCYIAALVVGKRRGWR